MLKWLTHTVCLHAFHILFHLIWKFGFEKKNKNGKHQNDSQRFVSLCALAK